MADKLTKQQEAFAFSVGFENKNYSEAYREHYKVKKTTTDRAVWVNASKLANSTKVSLRIDQYKQQRQQEISRTITWDWKQAEISAKRLLAKNMNDLVRSEVLKEGISSSTNLAIIQSIKLLNDIYEKAQPENNKISEELFIKAKADSEIAKAKILTDTANKLEGNLKNNELLQALINVPVVEREEGDSL